MSGDAGIGYKQKGRNGSLGSRLVELDVDQSHQRSYQISLLNSNSLFVRALLAGCFFFQVGVALMGMCKYGFKSHALHAYIFPR